MGTAVLAGVATAGAVGSVAALTGGNGPTPALAPCFTADPADFTVGEGEMLTLDARCSTPDTITRYRWDLGDGRAQEGPLISVVFPQPGTAPLDRRIRFDVVLTVEAGGEMASSPPRSVEIIPRNERPVTNPPPVGQNEPPVACFETDPNPPVFPVSQSLRLDASCSTADQTPGGSDVITKYEWNLGDGRTKEGRVISSLYEAPGSFEVTLTVTDAGGGSTSFLAPHPQQTVALTDSTTKRVTVQNDALPPADVSLSAIDDVSGAPSPAKPFEIVYTITNAGPNEARGLILSETRPAPNGNATEAVSSQASCSLTAGNLLFRCEIDPLPSGASAQVAVTFVFDPPPASFTLGGTLEGTGFRDPNPSNNTIAIPFTFLGAGGVADVALSLQVLTQTPVVGQPLLVSLEVSNLGPDIAEAVDVFVNWPSTLTQAMLVGAAPCQITGTSANCSFVSLGLGTTSVQFSYQPTLAGSQTIDAVIESTGTTDPNDGNDSDARIIDVSQAATGADLFLTASWSPPGPLILTLGNQGPELASNIDIVGTVAGQAPISFTFPPECVLDGPMGFSCFVEVQDVGFLLPLNIGIVGVDGASYVMTATVKNGNPADPVPFNDTVTVQASFPIGQRSTGQGLEGPTSFVSLLELGPPDGTVRSRVQLNDSRMESTDNQAPFRHQYQGRIGTNRLIGELTSGIESEGFWKFDLSSARHFVPGSLRVELGQVVRQDGYSVVFRLSGARGERIQFTYELRP